MILDLVKNHEAIITVEEGSSGGFGSNVLSYLSKKGLLDDGLKIRNIYLPDQFISQGNMEEMYEEAGLKADDIVATALKMFEIKDSNLKIINP
jgi:1-deoxy-D-xylulose-5-phosphate synthase